MVKRTFILIPLIAAALVFAGCQSSSSPDDKTYSLKGTVTSVDAAAKKVRINHEDVPGLMKAMEMNFTVEDAKLLEGISVGSRVEGRVNSKYVLSELKARASAEKKDKRIQEALAKLSPEDRTLAEAQKVCPESGQLLGSMDKPVKLMLNGKPVFICCGSCKDEAEKDPEATLQKVAASSAK